jgi:hypothetical protein
MCWCSASMLIGIKVGQLQLLAQEHACRDPRTRDLKAFRLDFCAAAETEAVAGGIVNRYWRCSQLASHPHNAQPLGHATWTK